MRSALMKTVSTTGIVAMSSAAFRRGLIRFAIAALMKLMEFEEDKLLNDMKWTKEQIKNERDNDYQVARRIIRDWGVKRG